jgi:hypothetical protein
MNPIKFPGHNLVMGEGQPEYAPLPACRAVDGACTFCYELDDADMAKLMVTRKLWIQLLTFGEKMQPLLVAVDKPPLGHHTGLTETRPESAADLCAPCHDSIMATEGKAIFLNQLCVHCRREFADGHQAGVIGITEGKVLVRKDHDGN